MKCDLSFQDVTTLDSVLVGPSRRVSSYLMDWWILFTKVPCCPLSGHYLTDDQLANVLMFSHCDLQPTLRDFEKDPTKEFAYSAHELSYLRLSFWSQCMSQVLQETISDSLTQEELVQVTKMVFHGAVRECPTQVLNDLVHVHKACLEVPDARQALDVNFLKNLVQTTVRYLMTQSKTKTLEMLSQQTLPVMEPFHAQLLTSLLANSFHEEYLELLGF